MDGGCRDDKPVRKCRGNIRQLCVFLHNKCPSTRQSHLKRVICLSFPLAKGLRLYQQRHDEFSADTHSVWALSEHAFKWTLSSSASFYTRISKLSLLSSTTSNTITTAVLALLHPLPFRSYRFSLSHFLLWHFSYLVHITKDSFHLRFMMDSSTFFKAPYAISEFVAALNQTTKNRKPSFLTTLSLSSFFLPLTLLVFEPEGERQHPGDHSIKAASQPPGWCIILGVDNSAMRPPSSMTTAV